VDIKSIPDALQSKLRIAIVACLMTGEKTFKEIKEITGATDGNLSIHLTKLENVKYIIIKKDFKDNKPRTRYSLTEIGRHEFIEYVAILESIIKEAKNAGL